MSYRYDRQQKQRNQRYFLIGGLLLLAFFTPVYSWVFKQIERPLARGWEARNGVLDGSENFFQSWYGKQQILKKNQELKLEIARLEIDNLRIGFLNEERERLLQIENMNPELLPAEVLHSGVMGNKDTLLVNQGSDNGVRMGDAVFVFDNVLVGYISKVFERSSEITLYGKSGESVSGILYPRESVLRTQGYGKGSFLIETPREVAVEVGDILYGMNEKGSIIAIVRDIVFDPRDPFKQVYLSSPVNSDQIQTVGIKIQK